MKKRRDHNIPTVRVDDGDVFVVLGPIRLHPADADEFAEKLKAAALLARALRVVDGVRPSSRSPVLDDNGDEKPGKAR